MAVIILGYKLQTWTYFYSTTTTTPGNTDEGDGHPICGNSAGLKPDPDNCEKYYSCQDDGQGKFLSIQHRFSAWFYSPWRNSYILPKAILFFTDDPFSAN